MPFDVTPNPPNIALVLSSSPSGILPQNEQESVFGSVYKINAYSIYNIRVGNIVMFNRTKATLVTLDTTTYFILDEADVDFTDNGTPP